MDIKKLVRPGIAGIDIYQPGEEREDHAKLSSNENPLSPHPRIIAAVTQALEEANRYPISGSPQLTQALADFHGVTPGEIMVGAGSNEIIDLLVRAFVGPDEAVVYPVPSFIVYGLIAKICGCRGVAVPCRDYRLDLEAMRDAIDNKTRMVFICNPNNPTSTIVSGAEVDAFLDGLREDVIVVMDEAYVDYVDDADYPDSLALRHRRNTLITLRTFSKFYAIAGIRIGYAIADPVVVDTLHRVRQPFNVSRLAQVAGFAALECREALAPMAHQAIRERKRVRAELLALGINCPPSQANFLFVDLGDHDLDLHAALAARGVIIRRLGQFGSALNTYRITIGTPEENDRLLDALRAVVTA